MVRISSGRLKGFVVKVPKHVRATEGKVRQALFNILGARLPGARVLDGFAGSGALGLEALSREAGLVVFLESHRVCVGAIEENMRRLGPEAVPGRWELCPDDALRAIRRLAEQAEVFDLILLDPPYEGELGKKALRVVADCGILARAGLVALEHARATECPAAVGDLTLRKQHRYGETVLSFYQAA